MPQLSSLNWILLVMFFWMVLMSFSILIWWYSKTSVFLYIKDGACLSENKWGW